MANTAHRNLTASDIHEPKGADTASAGETYVADGVGGGTWVASGALRIITQEIASLNTATTYYVVCPFAGRIVEIDSVIHGAIGVGDATLTAKIDGTTITNGAIVITQSGSAAGDVDTSIPTALNEVAVDETLEITVSGSQTGGTRCTVTWDIQVI